MPRVAAVFVLLIAVAACGTTTIPSTSVKTCHASSDCPAGYGCEFSVYESCDSPGVCITNPDGAACVPQTACGCDGATETVCLVNGNSPSPILSLGSCDGATQQGYDANVPGPPDSSVPTPDADTDAADAFVPPADTGPTVDSAPGFDAADSAPPSTLGSPCSTNTDCTDPAYKLCQDPGTGTKICTRNCVTSGQCQPPANGACVFPGYCVLT